MDAALSPLRQVGIRILNYLDDWLILALTSHKTLLLSHLGCLGLRVNFAKSILSPSQRVSFLGTVIDICAYDINCLSGASHGNSAPRGSLQGRYRPSAQSFPENDGPYGSGFAGTSVGSASHATQVPSAGWRHGRHCVTVTRACVSALACWRDLFWLKQGMILDTAHRRKVVMTDASNRDWGLLCEVKPTFGL